MTSSLAGRADTTVTTSATAVLERELEALFRFARRMGLDAADAEDALQEVALVFMRRHASLEESKVRAFLFGVLYKVATRMRDRRRKLREVGEESALLVEDPHGDPEEQLAERRARQLLDTILDAMPDDQRAVFVLCDIEECTMADVAIQLEMPAGTVASRLRRAREVFESARRRLDPKYGRGLS
jgi:RNA polymerase sigma-70 factor, ECF subfamily